MKCLICGSENIQTVETMVSERAFIEANGFSIIDIQENFENGILGNSLVLSVLFKNRNLQFSF